MDTKAAFEKWCDLKRIPTYKTSSGEYSFQETIDAWEAWQASRAAIEIDLENLCYIQVEEGTFYLDEGSVEAVLTSHGIRIKGKTE